MATSTVLPPIYRDCQRLLRHTEEVVMRFSRYHKYTVGADLRRQAFTIMRRVHRAVYDRPQQAHHLQALVWQVDDYKLSLQLAMDLGAFVHGKTKNQQPQGPGFAAFETVALLAAAIGKQCGGWLKKMQPANASHAQDGTQPHGCAAAGLQPAAPSNGVPQTRPTSLSARAAFCPPAGQEATP